MRTVFLGRAFSFVALLAFSGLPSAFAESIAGTWSFVSLFAGTPYYYDMTFQEQGGVITGTGGNGGWTITGTISGNQVAWSEDYVGSSYYADRVGTISGNFMSGTWGNQSQNGTWTATRTSTGGGGGNTPGAKRKTAITLFCNRTGVNLETAQCSVTVADQGPPPRLLPPGAVDFSSSNGFFPASAQCFLQQVSFSPGVGACQAQFAVPAGFPIGVPFPIEVAYPGDETFEGSSSTHKAIKAGCVSVPGKPCPNSIGLSFNGIPQIINNLLSMLADCGGTPSASSPINVVTANDGSAVSLLGDGFLGQTGNCQFISALGLDLEGLLEDVPQVDLEALGRLYRENPLQFRDALLQYASEASQLEAGFYQVLQQNHAAVREIQSVIERNILNLDWTKLFDRYRGPGSFVRTTTAARAAKAKRKNTSLLVMSRKTTLVKAQKRGAINLKLNPRGRKLLPALKQAGLTTIPMKVSISVRQVGIKSRANVTESVDVVL